MTLGYRRALLKISGEALAGSLSYGWDQAKTLWIAEQIAVARGDGRDLGIVIGGGNILRGKDAASLGVPHLAGDHMGMIATVLNAMALVTVLESLGVPALTLSAFPVGRFVEPFENRKALGYLEQGNVLVFAGGTGNPCFTTDSAAALRAVEIKAEVLVKCTQVDGVYDKDPKEHSDAVFFESISPAEILKRRLEVIDASAVDILGRNSIPAIVLNLHQEGNIRRALAGEKVGTTIK
jgi:uridylate kinase